MGQQVIIFSKFRSLEKSIEKSNSKKCIAKSNKLETKWSNYKQVAMTELVCVARHWEDLWLGVKG